MLRPQTIWSSCSLGFLLALPGTAVAAPPRRVVVGTIQAGNADAGLIDETVRQLTTTLTDHGFEVVAADDVQAAVKSGKGTTTDCFRDKSCLDGLIEQVHADLVITGNVASEKKLFTLTLALMDVAASGSAKRTSASLHHLKDVPTNVEPCLQRLFKWGEAELNPLIEADPSSESAAATPGIEVEEQLPDPDPADVKTVQRDLVSRKGALRGCYEDAAKNLSSLKGGLTIRFTIALDGTISEVSFPQDTIHSTAIQECIHDQAMAWKLARLKGNVGFSLDLPITFKGG